MEQPITAPLISIAILGLQGIATLLVTLIGWWVKGISAQLREMNGSVRDLRAWKEMHQPQDEQRHKENREEHKDIWRELKIDRESR